MSEQLNSVRKLAKAIGKSHTAVSKWLKHNEWEWPRIPPWNSGDVEEMRVWAAEVLAPDPNRERAERDPFWKIRIDWPALPIPDDVRGQLHPDTPKEIYTPYERSIVAGRRKPTRADLAELVTLNVRFRALMAQMCVWLPSWLEGHDEREIGRRLRSEVYERTGWLADVLARMGKK